MSSKPLNRQSLKSLFKNGKRPNETNFASLIDSTLNQVDDGISRNIEEGLILSPKGKDAVRLISFKDKIQNRLSKWGIDYVQKGSEGLAFVEPVSVDKEATRLFLAKGGNLGVGTEKPRTSLEVNGILSAESRIGTYRLSKVPADGKWHTILSNLNGYSAFEIVAQVGKPKSGRHALLHAHALSTYGKSRSRIRKTQARYKWWWWDKINLRWTGDTYNYQLQIKTRSNYGSDQDIKYYITKLWDDDIMTLFNDL
ncbi:hypothetical protein QWY87_11620 [Lutimonas halocynthiae]|uniref:hypothetical protein n=1 Tax=Lutimonas halocynthiae TaxID=1446477 RepID=UPI0025B54CA1|nr:hypothetical protein [Lutimonas halocynthiae]MDN3643355.1 hypothetical protein [Lutimonas halocynthiae]